MNATVARIRDIQVAGGVDADTQTREGAVQLGVGRRAVVAAETNSPVSRHRRDHAVRNLADDLVVQVCDIQVAGGD